MKKTAILLGLAAAALTGCLEVPQEALKSEAGFSGKPDTSAFESRTYNGNQQAWADDIKARHLRQHEYVRTGLAPAAVKP